MEEKIMLILNGICGAEPGELELNMDLFESGLLDSFGVAELLVGLEESFSLTLDIAELSREQIATPARIIQLVRQAL